MNDCLWCNIVCEGTDCSNCDKKININSKRGKKMFQEYNDDVRKALQPVYNKYFKLFENEN